MGPERVSLLVFGALHYDVIVRAPRFPAPGETLMGSAVDYAFGGKGGNQALAAAASGGRVAMAGCVGNDAAGRVLLAGLDAGGIDRTRVRTVAGASGMSVAVVEETGENAAVVVSGVNRDLTGEDFDLPSDLTTALLQNEIPMSANLALARRLPEGVRLILNAAPAGPLPQELLDRTDVLIVNRIEAEMLAEAGCDPVEMASRLRGTGPEVVVVTLGGEGVVAAGPDGLQKQPAEAVTVQSTHGAGDAFCGAFAVALDAGAGLDAALNTGQAAAARKVAQS